MKKILSILSFLLIFSITIVFSQTGGPPTDIGGDFGSTDIITTGNVSADNASLTGTLTLSEMDYAGYIRNDEDGELLTGNLASGLITYENWLLNSDNFTKSEWTTTGTTGLPSTDNQTWTQDASVTTFISQEGVPSTDTKLLTALITCTPTSVNGQTTDLIITDSSGTIGTTSWRLPSSEATTMRVKTTQASESDVDFVLENNLSIGSFGLNIQSTQIFESVRPELVNYGDSIALAAVDASDAAMYFKGQTYAMQYANAHGLEVSQHATAGWLTSFIRTEMQNTLPGNFYSIVMLQGGINDFNSDFSATGVETRMTACVELAKASADTVVLVLVATHSASTGSQQTQIDLYNAAMIAKYANSEMVTTINPDDLLVAGDLNGVHLEIVGHNKLFVAIEASVKTPYFSESYSETVTEDIANNETSKKGFIDGLDQYLSTESQVAFNPTIEGLGEYSVKVNPTLVGYGESGITAITGGSQVSPVITGTDWGPTGSIIYGLALATSSTDGISGADDLTIVTLAITGHTAIGAGVDFTAQKVYGVEIRPISQFLSTVDITTLKGIIIRDVAEVAGTVDITTQTQLQIEKPTKGDTNQQIKLEGNGDGTGIWFDSAERVYSDGTNFCSAAPIKAVGGLKSSDGTAGITQSETGVTNFDIVIKNGIITSFTKN